jgi:hypothetical protein
MAICSRPDLPDLSPSNSSSSAASRGSTSSASRSSFIPAEESRIGRDRRTNSSTPAWSSSPLI